MTDTKEVPAHVRRMIEEGEQLTDRLEKLGKFLVSETYQSLRDTDQSLLSAQCGAMTAYLQILSLRIERALPSA